LFSLTGVVANSLAENEAARVGCTAFGVAALLYTVSKAAVQQQYSSSNAEAALVTAFGVAGLLYV
jgi:hypothetical protein